VTNGTASALADALRHRYTLERELGRGGMATVYLARDLRHNRSIAVKVLHPELAASLGSERFLREIQIAGQLSHSNILPLHDSGEADGLLYYVMPYVEGNSLRQRLAREKQLSLEDALRITGDVADALAFAHARGVIHRDIKPENILLQGDRALVSDFGIARAIGEAGGDRLTETGLAVGTPAYMSTEQASGAKDLDARTDIYSLGCVLYEMLAGTPPYTGATAQAILARKAVDPVPSLRVVRETIPPAVERVVTRALAKVPADRFATATQFKEALAQARTDDTVLTRRTPPGGAARARPRLRWLVAAALLVAIGVAAALARARVRERPAAAAPAPPAPAEPVKLAVLPFDNLTGDSGQDYFSNGLTEEMIAQLGRLNPQHLGVIARASVMRYKNSSKPLDQIGRELGVQYILEGSARREADRVRITTQLIRTSDQTQLWTDSYESKLTDVLSLQTAVTRDIAKSLALTLLPGESARLAGARTVNPDAYEAYLQGREKMQQLSAPNIDAAEKYFQVALQKDPQYALAHAGIALVWIARQQMQFVPPRVAVPRAKEAAEQALDLDSTLAEAHYRLAAIKTWSDWDWPGAEREFQRAIELNPNFAEARASYSHYLIIMKRPAEAMTQIERALELDPLSELLQALYGQDLINLGRYDEAIAKLNVALRTASGNPMVLGGLSNAYYLKRMYAEALAAERSWWATRGDSAMVTALDRGHAEAGFQGAMRRAAETLAAKSRATNIAPYRLVQLYVKAGDQDQAIAWLEKSYEARDPNMPYIGIGAVLKPLHGDPRFQDLLRRMNLPS
jgi:eukaryotic-like serine/threonine-protein kinase